MLRKKLLINCLGICFIAATSNLLATTTWTNSGGGLWNVAGNWDNGVPDRSISGQEDALIDPGAASDFTVTYNNGTNINLLTVNNSGSGRATLEINNTLTTFDTQKLETSSHINVNSNGILKFNSGVANKSLFVRDGATLNVNGGTVDARDNFGYIGGFNNDGFLNITDSGTFKTRKFLVIGNGKGGTSWTQKTKVTMTNGGNFIFDALDWNSFYIARNMIADVIVSNSYFYVDMASDQSFYIAEAVSLGPRALGTMSLYDNSVVTNKGNLVVGSGGGVNNRYARGTINIYNGNWIQMADMTMGVTNYDEGTLNISNGIFRCDSNVYAAKGGNAYINIAGGTLAITNTAGDATLYIGSSTGTGTVEVIGGKLEADQLYATNGVNSVLNISNGIIAVASGIISNNTTLTIGNGNATTELALLKTNNTLTVYGDVMFAENSLFSVETFGGATGQYSYLDVYGNLDLDNNSAVEIKSVNYTPAVGDEWRIAVADSISGLPDIAEGYSVRVINDNGRQVLIATIPPKGTTVIIQ